MIGKFIRDRQSPNWAQNDTRYCLTNNHVLLWVPTRKRSHGKVHCFSSCLDSRMFRRARFVRGSPRSYKLARMGMFGNWFRFSCVDLFCGVQVTDTRKYDGQFMPSRQDFSSDRIDRDRKNLWAFRSLIRKDVCSNLSGRTDRSFR